MPALDQLNTLLSAPDPTPGSELDRGGVLEQALKLEGVDGQLADVARSVYQQESDSGRNAKTSNAGARGGMQILPATFNEVADKGWNIDDPLQNARSGIRYLKQRYEQAGGDPVLAAAGYYGGPAGLEKARRGIATADPRNPSAPNTLQYGQQVAARLGGASAPQDEEGNTAYVDGILNAALSYKAPEPEKPAVGVMRTIGDTGIKVAQGVVDLGASAVGLGSLATGGKIGEGMRALGYDPKRTNEILGEYLSDSQKASDAKVAEADGFVDAIVAGVENPRSILGGIAQSLPGMLMGMGVSAALASKVAAKAALATVEGRAAAQAALAAGKSASQAAEAAVATTAGRTAATAAIESGGTKFLAAGAATEGAQSAGQIADDAQASGRKYGDYALPALAAGAGTAAIGFGAGKLMGDAATEIATGAKSAGVKGGMAARAGKEFLSEGVLEEMPQSAQEQFFTNIAQGEDDLGKGVGNAAGTGLLVGGVQGAGMGALQRRHTPTVVPDTGVLSRAANAGQQAVADKLNAQPEVDPGAPLPFEKVPITPPAPAGLSLEQPAERDPNSIDFTPETAAPSAVGLENLQRYGSSGFVSNDLDALRQYVLRHKEGGHDFSIIPHVNGGYTVAPTDRLTPFVLDAVRHLQPDAAAQDAQTGTPARSAEQSALAEQEIRRSMSAPTGIGELGQLEPERQEQVPQKTESNFAKVDEAIAAGYKLHGKVLVSPNGKPYRLNQEELAYFKKAEQAAATNAAARAAAESVPAAPAVSAPMDAEPEFTTTKDLYGKTVTVRTADLSGNRNSLQLYSKAGKQIPGRIARENLDPTGEKLAANNAANANNPFLNVITTKDGRAFKSKIVAGREMNRRGLSATHEVVPASEVSPNASGYVVRRMSAKTLGEQIDSAAHEAATSPQNDIPEPTDAQKEAGNYKVGRIKLHGLDISIENPAGSVRSGVDRDGTPWENEMQHHYGYIRGTVGADKDHIDTFIGPNHESDKVFVVDQVHPDSGKFDEHKIVLGANNLSEAKEIYAANYAVNWRGGKSISELSIDDFKKWLKSGNTKKAFSSVDNSVFNKGFSNTWGADTKGSTNAQHGLSSPVKDDGFIKVPLGSAVSEIGRGNSSGGESVSDGGVSNSKFGGDSVKTPAGVSEQNGLVEAPLQSRKMDGDMLPLGHDRKVFDGVVKPIPVDVVNNLGPGKRPSDVSLHDNPVLKPLPSDAIDGNTDKPVGSPVGGEGPDVTSSRGSSHSSPIELKPNDTTDASISGGSLRDEKDATQIPPGLAKARALRDRKKAEQFVAAPDGSLQFGEITQDVAQKAKRQAGEIRLQQGNAEFGLIHIEQRHGDQIRAAGFESVPEFLAHALNHIDSIWQPNKTSQLVAIQVENGRSAVFVQLKPSEDGDFYTINTAFPAGKDYAEKRKGWKELWSRVPVPAEASGAPSHFAEPAQDAGKQATMESGQSKGDDTLSAGEGKFSQGLAAGQSDLLASSPEQKSSVDVPAAVPPGLAKARALRDQKRAEQFVPAPDGSLNFGEITPEIAKQAKRQAGKIRLQQGVQNPDGTGYGRVHIEANHGKEILAAGFSGVEDFVASVARNFNQVWQATKTRQLLVAVRGSRQDVMFVQLEPMEGGDYYRVNSAFPAQAAYFGRQERKGIKKLWDGSEPASVVTGQQPAYAAETPDSTSSQGSPTARGQSGHSVAEAAKVEKPLSASIGPNGAPEKTGTLNPREQSGESSVAPEDEKGAENAELENALAHLGDVLGDVFGAKLNATGQQHTAGALLPALSRVIELLVKKGARSFRDALTESVKAMRGNAAVAPHLDAISARQWKAAYNAIADFHDGTDSEETVAAISADDVRDMVASAAGQSQEKNGTQEGEKTDEPEPKTEVAEVGVRDQDVGTVEDIGRRSYASGSPRVAPGGLSGSNQKKWYSGYDSAKQEAAGKASENPENSAAPEHVAARADSRDQAEREITRQLNEQWSAQTGSGFAIGKHYPATIRLNGNERNLGLFKKKDSGVLYAEALDETMYGPVFTQYKVTADGKLEEVGTRRLFGLDKEPAKQAVSEFNALFEQPAPATNEAQPEHAEAPAEQATPELTRQQLNRLSVKDMTDAQLLRALAELPKRTKPIQKEIGRRGLNSEESAPAPAPSESKPATANQEPVKNVEPELAPAAAEAAPANHAAVKVPQSVDEALTADMTKQQARVKRLRTAATADGMTLDEKTAAQLKVTAAEATLRSMRIKRFDAEDAVEKAVADKDARAFAEFADLFPSAAQALQVLVPATESPAVESVSRLTQARNDLIEMRTQAEEQGRVADDRLLSRIRRQEALIKELETEQSEPSAGAQEESALRQLSDIMVTVGGQEQPASVALAEADEKITSLKDLLSCLQA